MFYEENNFFSEEERIEIKKRVLELKEHWEVVGPDFFTLGESIYLLEQKIPTKINETTKKIVIDNFGWIIERICKNIEKITSIKTIIHPKLPSPGFHISKLPFEFKTRRFHQDSSILKFDKSIDFNTVHSVLLLIEKPSYGAWLDYRFENKDEVQKYYYEYGKFISWKSDLYHKIGNLKCLPEEHRITLQCHYGYSSDMKKNLVYF